MYSLVIEQLRMLPFLEDAPSEVLDALAEAAILREYQAGEVIFEEGSGGHEMYVVSDGSVQIFKGRGNGEIHLANLGPGSLFGEMSMLENQPRSATVRAERTTRLFELSEQAILSILTEHPQLFHRFAAAISARLRRTDVRMIQELQQKNEELTRAYFELQRAQAGMVEKEKLEHELKLARTVQMSFIPSSLPRIQGYQFAARYQPARWVGGDLYDVFFVSRDFFGLLIADVSDKGVPAALYMALTRSLIRAEARRRHKPGQVLVEVNRLLQQVGPSDMFVTVFYGVVERKTGHMVYVRAGHNRPLLVRGGDTMELGGRGTPLGLMKTADLNLVEEQITLQSGDCLVLYSDGMTDVMSPQGEPFDLPLFRSTLLGYAGMSPGDLCDATFAVLEAYRGDADQFDDMTMLAAVVE